MFSLFKRKKPNSDEDILPLERAKQIIEAEIQRRGWESYRLPRYSLERQDGQKIWRCFAMPPHIRGPGMTIEIDAKTGELLLAKIGGP
jgi:uncharacterized membrane protein YkoI